MVSSQKDVEDILSAMRYAIDNQKFIPIDRGKNLSTLLSLGILWCDARDEIYALSYSDYIKGPEVDRRNPNSDKFWIFKKRIDQKPVYIKFKVLFLNNNEVKVVSFHFDEV